MQYVLQYYRHPLHHGALDRPTHSSHVRGKLCGDELHIDLKIDQGRIVDASFAGACCAVTTAAASVLLDAIIGLSVADLQPYDLDWILQQLQIELPKSRLECAQLPVDSVQEALEQPLKAVGPA